MMSSSSLVVMRLMRDDFSGSPLMMTGLPSRSSKANSSRSRRRGADLGARVAESGPWQW